MNLDTARSVIVLSPQGDDPDAHVIKTLLVAERPRVADRPARRWWPPYRESGNLAAARLAGGPAAQVVDADDIASRLVVQSSPAVGLSTVCTDLLDFDGDESTCAPTRASPAGPTARPWTPTSRPRRSACAGRRRRGPAEPADGHRHRRR